MGSPGECSGCHLKSYLISWCRHSACKQCLSLKRCANCQLYDFSETSKSVKHVLKVIEEESEQIYCSICLKAKESLIRNSCGHQYCSACIDEVDSLNMCFYHNCNRSLDQNIVSMKINPEICEKCGSAQSNLFSNNNCPHNYCRNCLLQFKIFGCCEFYFDEVELNEFLHEVACEGCQLKRPRYLLFLNRNCNHLICWKCIQTRGSICRCRQKIAMRIETERILPKLCMICRREKPKVFKNVCFHQYCLECTEKMQENLCQVEGCSAQVNMNLAEQFFQIQKNGSVVKSSDESVCYRCNSVLKDANAFLKCMNCKYFVCKSCGQESRSEEHLCPTLKTCLQGCEDECICPSMYYCCCLTQINEYSSVGKVNPKCRAHMICMLCYLNPPHRCSFTQKGEQRVVIRDTIHRELRFSGSVEMTGSKRNYM